MVQQEFKLVSILLYRHHTNPGVGAQEFQWNRDRCAEPPGTTRRESGLGHRTAKAPAVVNGRGVGLATPAFFDRHHHFECLLHHRLGRSLLFWLR